MANGGISAYYCVLLGVMSAIKEQNININPQAYEPIFGDIIRRRMQSDQIMQKIQADQMEGGFIDENDQTRIGWLKAVGAQIVAQLTKE